MKSKPVTYFLISVVILVWGGIFYKIFSSFFSSDKSIVLQPKPPVVQSAYAYKEAESFTLVVNYRDPFLGKIVNDNGDRPEKPARTRTEQARVKVPASPPFDWNFVKYLGLIKKPGSEVRIALISVHGKDIMIREGETVGEVKCTKHYKDSIQISYQGRKVCIKK